MPGHIGSSIIMNAVKVLGFPEIEDVSVVDAATLREQAARLSFPVDTRDDEQLRAPIRQYHEGFRQCDDNFRDNAPLSPAQAATIILDGVRNDQWRILVGEDAKIINRVARTYPEKVYDPGFMAQHLQAGRPSELFIIGEESDSE